MLITFDVEEDPVFQVINSYTRTNPNSSIERQTRKSNIRIELGKQPRITVLASRNTKILEWGKLMAITYPLRAKLARKVFLHSNLIISIRKSFFWVRWHSHMQTNKPSSKQCRKTCLWPREY